MNKFIKIIFTFLQNIFSFPKKVVIAIKNSYFRTLKGEENLAIVVLGWGVLLYVLSFLVGFLSIYQPFIYALKNENNINHLLFFILFASFIFPLIGCLGIMLLIFYPIVFILCLIKILIKRAVISKLIVLVSIVIFIKIHIDVSHFLFLISVSLIKENFVFELSFSKIIPLTMIILIIFIIIRFFYISFKKTNFFNFNAK